MLYFRAVSIVNGYMYDDVTSQRILQCHIKNTKHGEDVVSLSKDINGLCKLGIYLGIRWLLSLKYEKDFRWMFL